MRRSWDLVGGHWWHTAFTVLLAGLLTEVVNAVITAPFGAGAWFVQAVAAAVATTVTLPYGALVGVLLYLDLRPQGTPGPRHPQHRPADVGRLIRQHWQPIQVSPPRPRLRTCRRDCGDLDGEEPEMADHRRHPAPSSWLLVPRLGIASVGATGGETGVSPIATTRTPLNTPPRAWASVVV
jgi:hypothetical protein